VSDQSNTDYTLGMISASGAVMAIVQECRRYGDFEATAEKREKYCRTIDFRFL
jgi:hypothetical protein